MDLAILTGQAPAFSAPLHVGRPNIGNRKRFFELTQQMLDRGWLTNNGPLVQEFESEVTNYVGTKHCVCFCNATIALEIAIRAIKLEGEVIIPSFTFVATAHALQWHGIQPVFCDIDPVTHCIDPAKVESLITPRTSAIIGVHLWGRPCNVVELAEIARRKKLMLLFDAAHAFGCSHKNKMIGGFGNAEVFSFHATKFFNTFEGGAIVTDDDRLAYEARLMRNFGFAGFDKVVGLGSNGKMPEVSGAMGLASFSSLEEFLVKNRRNFETYRDCLAGISGLRLLEYEQEEKRNYQYIVLEIDEKVTALGRDDLIATLQAENVLARRYFWPGCHRMEPYKTLFPTAGSVLPQTNRVAEKVVVLPTGMTISSGDIETISTIVRSAIQQSAKIRGVAVTSERN